LIRPRVIALFFVCTLGFTLGFACGPTGEQAPSAEPGVAADGTTLPVAIVTLESLEPSPQPDLILIVVDTLRADHLSTYGYERPTSPNLDALAKRGVVFEDVTAQSSWTLPSMASMLTGRHLFVNAQRLPPAAPSLAERLSEAGYETAAFVGNFAVGRAGQYDRGFDHFITRQDTGGSNWDAPDLEAAVNDWLDTHPRGDKPRFLYLHFLDPHWPYAPPADAELIGQVKIANDTLESWIEAVPEEGPIRQHFNRDRESILADIDAYDREIVATDAAIGRLMKRLGRRPHMVLVSSDHGECLWDRKHHPLVLSKDLEAEGRSPESATLRDVFFRDHSYHMFQELLFTPLIVAGPELDMGVRIDTAVENVDIVPTFLRAAGIPDDDGLDGLPLQEVVSLGAYRETLYSHSHEATVVRDVSSGKKLIWPTETGFYFGMPIMLFHLDSDPHERANMATEDAAGFRHLSRQRELADSNFDLFDNLDASVNDPEFNEALKELGYIGEGFTPQGGAPRPPGTDDHGR
jgi:arylsulfatase A-like enzyme